MGRVIAAGLLAGLVLNIGEAVLHGVIFADEATEAMRSLGREIAGSGTDTAQLVLITLIQGVIGMVLYFQGGRGLPWAIAVGLMLWALSAVYSAVYLHSGFTGVFPSRLIWGPVGYELLLYPLAIVTGRAVLREVS